MLGTAREDRVQTLRLIRSSKKVILGYCPLPTEEMDSPRGPGEMAEALVDIEQDKWKLLAGELNVD